MRAKLLAVMILLLTNILPQGVDLNLNSDVKYRTITGLDAGNYLDITLRPTLEIGEMLGSQFFVNVPYNLSTNQIRKVDLKIGNVFKYARLGDQSNYISAGALQDFKLGFSSMVVNGYNNQLDETNRKVGATAGINFEGFSASAMTNDISKPKVFAGSVGMDLPLMDVFKVNISAGYDADPDNNNATSSYAAAYGIDILSSLPIDNNNYFYAIVGAAQIHENGNGQVAMGGARFGTEEFYLDISGALMRLGPGFEWGFFDTYYEKDRNSGIDKTTVLKTKYPKATGGSNISAFLGYAPNTKEDFSLQFGGYYFTNYGGTDLNKLDAVAYLYVPRSIMGESGELLSATITLRTRAFEDISGLVNQLKNPDDKTVISMSMPVTILPDLGALGALAFVLTYDWKFAFDTSQNLYVPQKNLLYGFRLISNF